MTLPPKEEMLSFRIPERDANRLRRAAERNGVSVSELLRHAAVHFLSAMDSLRRELRKAEEGPKR